MGTLADRDAPEIIGDLVAYRATARPDHEIIRFPDASLTYGRLDEDANRLASSLASMGLTRGTACAVQLPNSAEFVVTWIALARLGVLEVPVSTSLRGDLLAHQLLTADCEVVVTTPAWIGRFADVADRVPRVRAAVLVGDDAAGVPLPTERFTDLVAAGDARPPGVEIRPHEPAVVLFTSGTTGPSKGVLRTHRANTVLARTGIDLMGYTAGEVLFNAFPLFHANARYNTVLAAMTVDGSVVLRDQFSVSGFWDDCRAEGVTAFNYMGAVLMMLHKQPPRDDDADNPVRRAFGAPAPVEIFHEFQERFGVQLVEVYGSTELGIATMNTVEEFRLGSCGRAAPSYEIEIHDEHDERCPPGVVGEIVARSRQPFAMFDEYVAMPEATVAAFRNQWFHTGDRARMDDDGYVYYVDRTKDCIRRRGENISSWEVERTILGHDLVAEVAVIGVPSELTEEEVMAVVVPKPGVEIDPVDLLDHCQERLPRFAVPRYVRMAAELPKTPSQRVEKYRLRAEGVTVDTWDRADHGYEVRR
jgi:crotonobetaine/carnitine-CoA ligase